MTYLRPPTPWLKKGKANRKTIHSQVFVPASQEVDKDGLNRDSYFSEPALPSSPLAASTLKLEYLKLDSPKSPQPQSYTPIFSFINEYFSNDILQKTPDEEDFLKRPEKSSYPRRDLERSYFSDDSSDSSGEGTLQDENNSFSDISDQDETKTHPHVPSSEAQYKLRMRIYCEQKLRSLSMRQHRSINVMEWLNSVDA